MANDEVSIALRILEELRIDSLGILYSDEDYGRSVTNIFNTEFIKKGGRTRSEPLPLESRDFREQVREVKDMEAVYVVGFPHHFKFAFKELSRQNFKGYKLAASTASRPPAVKLPQNDGVYVSAPKIYDPDFLFAKEVGKKYEERFGRPFSHFAANGYDIVKIIGGLLEDEGINRVNLRSLLEQGFIYPGIFGTISVRKGEHNIRFSLYPAQIIDGKLKYWW